METNISKNNINVKFPCFPGDTIWILFNNKPELKLYTVDKIEIFKHTKRIVLNNGSHMTVGINEEFTNLFTNEEDAKRCFVNINNVNKIKYIDKAECRKELYHKANNLFEEVNK